MPEPWQAGETVPIAVFVTEDGLPAEGLSPMVEIIRIPDDKIFDHSTGQFAATPVQPSGTMSEERPGYYEFLFDQQSADEGVEREYLSLITVTPPSGIVAEIHSFTRPVGPEITGSPQ